MVVYPYWAQTIQNEVATAFSSMWYVFDPRSFIWVQISLQFILQSIYSPPDHSGGYYDGHNSFS